jgi:D-cysteine desulfhydrase
MMLTSDIDRVPIAYLPTPLRQMKRLTEELDGPRLFVKRDDQTGLATGGNKARKLEFLIAEALAEGADTALTVGAAQSNHARQTAAAAAMHGLGSILILEGSDPGEWNGNLLLDNLLGARVRWAGDKPLHETMMEVAVEEETAGRHPYLIPVGGSNPMGALGYVAAMEEMIGQLEEQDLDLDAVVFASSSGGTQVGLMVGAKALRFKGQVVGISVAKKKRGLREILRELASETAELLRLDLSFDETDFVVYDDYVGGGYGVMGDPEREAIRLVAGTEGILLDPVYTGRAMAGLIDLIRKGVFGPDQTVLFWHTGGIPALFAYRRGLVEGGR